MATSTLDEKAQAPSYSEFSIQLSWDINEVSFRIQAALSLLHTSDDIDADQSEGLALSYLLRGTFARLEELALRAADSYPFYEAKTLEVAHG